MLNPDYGAKLAGNKLRKLIKQHGGSQEAFAADFGADTRTINRYINEGINKVGVIQDLATYFDVPMSYFFIEGDE